ncbi:MAG: PmoA family protein [Bryobacteraceae bacterium]
MNRLVLWHFRLCAGMLFAAALLARPARSAELPKQFRWERGDSSIALLADGKTVWQFRYGKELPKPMFHPLALVDGSVLTWDSPPDHPWHHALWFSWKYLNQVNYWEEPRRTGRASAADKNGEPVGLTDWSNVRIDARANFGARITLDLSYHEADRPPVVRERREITITAPDAVGEYHLDWAMTFTAGDRDVFLDRTPVLGDRGGVSYGGYAGLSIRLAKDFLDARTVTTTSAARAEQRVGMFCERDAYGVDFNGVISGQAAGVAFLDDPANLNSPTPWYLIVQPQDTSPFLFAEAAVIYYKPYVLKAGQSFTLRYRTVVHRGRWDSARLKAAQLEYVKGMKRK